VPPSRTGLDVTPILLNPTLVPLVTLVGVGGVLVLVELVLVELVLGELSLEPPPEPPPPVEYAEIVKFQVPLVTKDSVSV
jgi:hypothetical protein